MPPFVASIGDIVLIPLEDGKRFVLAEDVLFRYGDSGWNVPAGVITDFASIPGIGRIFLGKWGRYGPASIWHDWAYSKAGPSSSRKEIDTTFLKFMKVSDTPIHEQFLIYYSVRAFGWLFFKKK